MALNRGKRSVVFDLRDDADRDLAIELARRADVLVENFMPGRMDDFGLGYSALRTVNPRLVYCSISGFGADGLGAALPGYDLLGQAASGLMSVTGPSGSGGFKTGVAIVDVLCGLHGLTGVLAALQARERSDEGQHVQVDLMSSALSALTNLGAGTLLGGQVPQPLGNAHPSVAPYEPMDARDGVVVIAAGTDPQFRALCVVVGMGALADDPRFATNATRVTHREELLGHIRPAVRRFARDDLMSRLQEARVPVGPLNNIAQAFAYAEKLGLEPLWSIDGHDYVRSPIRLDRTPPSQGAPPPALDEDGERIRAWLARTMVPASARFPADRGDR